MVLAGAASADPSARNDNHGPWLFGTFEQKVTHEGWDHGRDRKKVEKTTIYGVALSTTDTSKPLTVLTCAPEIGLSVKVTGRPRKLEDTGFYAFGRRTSSRGEVFVDGDLVRANEWAIDTTDGSMVSFDAMTVAYIYDAAMKGLTVRLDLENRSAFDIHLPSANDKFPEFVEACPFLDAPAN